ncbi:hypothetical protein SAMN05518801_102398 [Novosphingobium sp. CF614]|uniref:hypothetical protein n=1 Tax=Novosphingobium sp. CF614 TaxID=1884364 RepID=UPI0008EB3C5D|nr:hypothetical protein [Novosphingobium sp. CF614]SFF87914.1 hypothetical protein SAMN05518801_102398 [Novosphingobium sp. CF614]
MKASIALSLTIAASLALGGCGKQEPDRSAAPGGEILPRSASDDMLPYDIVRSQPPLANPDAGKSAGDTGPRAEASASVDEADDPVIEEAAVPADEE